MGLTNTPVTNATTGSVEPDRVGMASGIDISARFITLSINIALMGSLLVSGIAESLQNHMNTVSDKSVLAERIAGGAEVSLSRDIITAVLTEGFSGVLIYGAVGVGCLSLASYLLFNLKTKAACGRVTSCPD